jgi:hypothetical protein
VQAAEGNAVEVALIDAHAEHALAVAVCRAWLKSHGQPGSQLQFFM